MRKRSFNYIVVLFALSIVVSFIQVSCSRVPKPGESSLGGGTMQNGTSIKQTGPNKSGDGDSSGKNTEGSSGSNANGTEGSFGSNANGAISNNTGDSSNSLAEQSGKGQNPDSGRPEVKALYLTGWTVGLKSKLEHYVNLANNTEINSYVVDIKDDDGYVGYESSIPAVQKMKSWIRKYDVDDVLKRFHDNNIHVIGRIVCFKDPIFSEKKPEYAIKNINGGLWKDKNKHTWIDPYKRDAWEYLVSIAKEALQKGFDEIQFDYVRFANDGDKKSMDFSSNKETKHEVIEEFLAYASQEMPGTVLSADVFGIICESPEDTEGIGQYLERVGKDIDYISPMVYPSHYALGQIVNKVKFPKPDFKPYDVVYNSLIKAKNRISSVSEYKAGVRPYLQDFTATWLQSGNYMSYGPQEVRQQIKAVYDAGYKEWILWDAKNTYDEDALLPEE